MNSLETLSCNNGKNKPKENSENVAPHSISNLFKSDECTVSQKTKNDSNLGTKSTVISKVNSNALSNKGYSAVTKASVNRAKPSVIVSNSSNNVSSTGLYHGRSSNGGRPSNLNSCKILNQSGKSSNANQSANNKNTN